MRHLDLFSGIGGFALAARWMNWETVQFVEIDPWAQKVLAKNFPGVPIHDDITTFDPAGPVDIITGGYPCQPFSLAGQRAGEDDDRHLWPEMLRTITAARPRYVVGENVAGHITLGLDEVLSDLAALGYTCRTFVIPACAVDAPHRRDRVWIVADADSQRSGASRSDKAQTASAVTVAAASQQSAFVAYSERERGCSRNTGRQDAENARQSPGCQEYRYWDSEPDVGRVANGIPRRVDRLRGLGNAIVPQVAHMIFSCLD